jgi:hypothetical protein
MESDRSAGWLTSESVEAAIAPYEKALGKPAEDSARWGNWVRAHVDAYMPAQNPRLMAMLKGQDPEYNKVMEEVRAAAGDMEKLRAALEHQQKLMAELKALPKAAVEKHPGVTALRLPGVAGGKLVIDERERRAARLVLAVPAPYAGKMLVIVAWDPKFFPPAPDAAAE